MASHFTPQLAQKIQGLVGRFETPRSSILPVLHAIQDEQDFIGDADIDALESEYKLSAIDVREVLTFYSMYRTQPPKPYRLEVCNSISCWLCDSEKTLAAAREHLAAAERAGHPAPFEVHQVECLGVCGYAPAALVNKDRHLNVTAERARELIDSYSKKELPPAALRCAEVVKSRGLQKA